MVGRDSGKPEGPGDARNGCVELKLSGHPVLLHLPRKTYLNPCCLSYALGEDPKGGGCAPFIRLFQTSQWVNMTWSQTTPKS